MFDNDGTLWPEDPVPFQLAYALDTLKKMVEEKPELRKDAMVQAALAGDFAMLLEGPHHDGLLQVIALTHAGMTTDEYARAVEEWITTAQHPGTGRLYTDMVYQPMLELLTYLRGHGFKTYIVSGGGQEFMRPWSERVYGIPPEQVVGSAASTKYGYDRNGKPMLTKEPKVLVNDNDAGKPESIHLMIGQRPRLAFGNSTGDQQMLEYTKAGSGARLALLLLHDDAEREYAYGPAQKLPATKVGEFTQALYDQARKDGWIVVSMKDDWKRVFAFE